MTAPSATELRTRRAIDQTSEAARRARKLLFQTDLWEHDQRTEAPAAKAGRWLTTAFPDAISARRLPSAVGDVGYLRLWTFDVGRSEELTEEVARVLRQLQRKPTQGLIIDLRSNPGGIIDTAERLLQLFVRTPPQPIQPVRFALRATEEMAILTEAEGNGADLADWADSVRTALDLGEEFSQHLPISDPEMLQQPAPAGVPGTGRGRRRRQHLLVRRHLRGRARRPRDRSGRGGRRGDGGRRGQRLDERRHRVRLPRRRIAGAPAAAPSRPASASPSRSGASSDPACRPGSRSRTSASPATSATT